VTGFAGRRNLETSKNQKIKTSKGRRPVRAATRVDRVKMGKHSGEQGTGNREQTKTTTGEEARSFARDEGAGKVRS
jgi:hypothetical protein